MKTPAKMSSLSGLLPLYFPRALAGLDDRLRAHWLVRGAAPGDITVVRRRTLPEAGLLMFELRRGAGSLVVKHPRNEAGAGVTAREREVLQELAADSRLAPWRPLLPRAVGSPGPAGTLAQNTLPGVPAERLILDTPDDPYAVVAPAMRLLAELWAATGRRRAAADRAEVWCEAQLTALSAGMPRYRSGRRAADFEALRHRLDAALAGAVLTEGWTHGDYHPGNVLLGGVPLRVTGVFDWSSGRADGPCEIDAYSFVLALRSTLTGRPLGGLVAETLRAGRVPDADRALLALAGLDPDRDVADPVAIPLLSWLWHVANNVRKSPRFGHSYGWLTHTVAPVLDECARWAGARSLQPRRHARSKGMTMPANTGFSARHEAAGKGGTHDSRQRPPSGDRPPHPGTGLPHQSAPRTAAVVRVRVLHARAVLHRTGRRPRLRSVLRFVARTGCAARRVAGSVAPATHTRP
ncbi:phosphotransferase family protein [Streptomyces sp. NPDC060027]|uniref:phosphotransferase family protein n=1 Tax=Streptomyces sp. NPDC060027 TaxID=3347040 RepID=UPI0036B4B47F